MRWNFTKLSAAVCLVLSTAGLSQAQFDPVSAETTAEQTKDAPLMKAAATAYLAAGDVTNARLTYLAAWDIARYTAIYCPNKWSTVTGVGGSGSRRAKGIADMQTMRTEGVPGGLTGDVDFDNTMSMLMEELQTLEAQGTAANPACVLGGPVNHIQVGQGRVDAVGLWQLPTGQVWLLKQVGTQVWMSGDFLGLGTNITFPQPGTFDGTTYRFDYVDEHGNRLSGSLAYSDEAAAGTNFTRGVLQGTVTFTDAQGLQITLPPLRLERIYNVNGGAVSFPSAG